MLSPNTIVSFYSIFMTWVHVGCKSKRLLSMLICILNTHRSVDGWLVILCWDPEVVLFVHAACMYFQCVSCCTTACIHCFMVLLCLFALFHIFHSSDFCQFGVQQIEGQSVPGVRELQGSPCACVFRTPEWEE